MLMKLNVMRRYVLRYVTVMLIPLLAIGILFYFIHLDAIKDEAVNLERYRIEQAQSSMDARMKSIIEVRTRVLLDDNLLPGTLKSSAYQQTTVKTLLSVGQSRT